MPICNLIRNAGKTCKTAFLNEVLCLSDRVASCNAQVYAKLESFEEDWAAGRVPGWEDRGEGPAAAGATPAIDLEAFEAVEELETLGAPGSAKVLPTC